MSNLLRLTLLTGTAFAVLSTAAIAAPAIGLVGGKTLVMFDTETLAVAGTLDVTGVDGLAGIDVRPADKLLYGVSLAGEVVTIDTATGAVTVKSTLSEKLSSYEGAIVDFNPMADRLRLMGTDGTNHRVNVDDAWSRWMAAWPTLPVTCMRAKHRPSSQPPTSTRSASRKRPACSISTRRSAR